MEAEQLLNMNHHVIEKEPEAFAGFTLEQLMARREQLIQALNGARAELEAKAQNVIRNEGALMAVNQMILELDPDAFKQQGS